MSNFYQESGKYGIKDIYSAALKAAVPIDILGTHYEPGDTILFFDSIQEAIFQENLATSEARGGFNNRSLVNWETTKEVNGILNMGTISDLGFGLMNRTKVKEIDNKVINQFEYLSINNEGKGFTKHPIAKELKVSIYQIENGQKIRKILDYEIDGNTIIIEDKNIEVFIDYCFYYNSKGKAINIGQKDLNGYLMFVGKFRYTNEYTGVQNTGIIEIPKLRIISNFSISLGRSANPLISALQFQGIPDSTRRNAKTVIITFLEEDIDGDF